MNISDDFKMEIKKDFLLSFEIAKNLPLISLAIGYNKSKTQKIAIVKHITLCLKLALSLMFYQLCLLVMWGLFLLNNH